MDVLQNTGSSLRADFVGPLGSLIPDANTVLWSIYDQTGALLAGPTSVSTGATDTGVIIALSSAYHTITAPRRFEKRQVLVTWTTAGQAHSLRLSYRVVPLVNYEVSGDRVRALLGLNVDELTDEELNIFGSYLSVEQEITKTVLDEALSSGTTRETAANELIAVSAALDVLPSLQLRTAASIMDGSKRFDRFRTAPDWELLAAQLSARRASLVADTTGAPLTGRPLAVFAQPTDVITG